MSLANEINIIKRDEFGRPSGIIALNKSVGETSHDLVDLVRGALKTRRVGHAGALDSFATGLLIILIGKDTKRSDTFLNLDKEYRARLLLGISTSTQDPEGDLVGCVPDFVPDKETLASTLQTFVGTQEQFVSPYSSVKVKGQKLRVLMRDTRFVATVMENDQQQRIIRFSPAAGQDVKPFDVLLPSKSITIHALELEDMGKISAADLNFLKDPEHKLAKATEFIYADIRVSCSKGTYIRQLAEDIGAKLKVPACLIKLERTKVGDVSITNCLDRTRLQEL